ncbi:MAG TPA: ribonuclease PH [Clostridiales bacterium UBA8153]|nr:ribonuclease PH [Clostridiales bacterium UBA8153]
MRLGDRGVAEARPITLTRGFTKFAAGSVLVAMGDTRVICTVSVEDRAPPFLRGAGHGWVTAEYAMLPGATPTRTMREAARGRLGGRTMEIQRFIGRSLRSVVDLHCLGERTLWVDCDVIQADGGTRTAAITGAFVAMVDALQRLRTEPRTVLPLTDYLAAVSVGMVGDRALLDLDYQEDSRARVDMNVVMTGRGQLVEVQGTGEGAPFSPAEMEKLLELAREGMAGLFAAQRAVLGELAEEVGLHVPDARRSPVGGHQEPG